MTAVLVAITVPAPAHDMGAMKKPASPQTCDALRIDCAATITPAVAPDGTLWLAGRVGDQLFVTHAEGSGFSLPVAINAGKVTMDWGPDARPQLAFSKYGTIVLAYSTFRNAAFDGEVFYARSTDGGRSFGMPQPITDVQESQRFPVVTVTPDGTLFSAWLDKRGRLTAKAAGKPFVGAGLAVASAATGQDRIGPATIVRAETCECCRIALAPLPTGGFAVMFRNIFPGGVRDHAVITSDAAGHAGPLHRVSIDDWATDVCPHHGPALAVAGDGSYQAAWFTQGRARKGLFYARSADSGATWSAPMPLSAPGLVASRPTVLAIGEKVWLAWKSFDGTTTQVMAMTSDDDGRHWGTAHSMNAVEGASDHPMLVARKGRPWLSWQTAKGYRLLPLDDAS